MSFVLHARKRAEEFEALLNGVPSERTDLGRLVEVVTVLRRHPAAVPRPDFVESLRGQLMTEAATLLSAESPRTAPPPARRARPGHRRLVATATAAVLVGGTTGIAAASQGALPGDALYPIKRTIERAQVGLNTSAAGKGEEILGQARDRLDEVRDLLGRRTSTPSAEVPAAIAEFGKQASQGSALLIESFQAERDPQHIRAVRSFAASSLPTLQELAGIAPTSAQGSLAEAARLVLALDQQALGLCGQCADDLPPLQTEDPLVSSLVREQAGGPGAQPDHDHVEQAAQDDRPTTRTPSAPATAPPSTPSSGDEPQPQPTDQPLQTVTDKVRKLGKTVTDPVAPVAPVPGLVEDVLPDAGELLDPVTGDLLDPLLGGELP